MDRRSGVSDFSMERILSPQFGHKTSVMEFPPGGCLQRIQGGFSLDSGNIRPPAPVLVPVPVPVSGCLQYRGMSFGEALYPCGAGFHHTDFSIYPNLQQTAHVHFSSSQDSAGTEQFASHHGYHQAGMLAQSRQKARMRTVFTDSQTKRLEALFELTEYPAVEARAEVARSTGLSEETVRVWFKNRRARRKRQRSGSKVKSPSSPTRAGAETKFFTSFL